MKCSSKLKWFYSPVDVHIYHSSGQLVYFNNIIHVKLLGGFLGSAKSNVNYYWHIYYTAIQYTW